MGKRRINIEKIFDKQKRHIAFSKRRKGLFKKAQELCSLTGATIGIVCFSEAGNPFTFCYPAPAEGQDGGDGRQPLLSIMQQNSASSNGRTITTDHSQPAPMGEPKAIGEDQNRATGLLRSGPINEMMWSSLEPPYSSGINVSDPGSYGFGPGSSWVGEDKQEMGQMGQLQGIHEAEAALLDSVLGQSVEEGLVKSSSCGSFDPVCTSNCYYSWPSPSPTPSPSIEAMLSSPSSSLEQQSGFLGDGCRGRSDQPVTHLILLRPNGHKKNSHS